MIHPTAVIDPAARLGEGVRVGAYTVIDGNVRIGDGTWIGHHCVITGHTTIGRDNRIFHGCSVGEVPQDKKYGGEPTRLEIGDRNTFREHCTVNVGTAQDVGVTRIGHDNWIMAYVHIAHDCQVGSHTIFANNATLAGHVEVGDWVIFGGFTGVHQFVRVGAHGFTAVGTVLLQDLPPYVLCSGNPAQPRTINSEGLRRRGFDSTAISALKRAYKALYRNGMSLEEARAQIGDMAHGQPELALLHEFLGVPGRGVIR